MSHWSSHPQFPVHLLSLNALPTISERQDTIAILEGLKSQEKECLAHITRLLEELQKHRARQLAIEKQIADCKNVLAPVLRLNPHILSEIFTFCAEDAPLNGPIVLGAVCRSWRTVALSTPQLWRHICIRLSNHSRKEVVHVWTSRSGILPLRITLRKPPNYDRYFRNMKKPPLHGILEELRPYLPRCEAFDIQMVTGTADETVFKTLESCSVIKEMSMAFEYLGDSRPSLRESFCSIPSQRIESLEMNDVDDSRLRLFALPFTNLRRLTLKNSRELSIPTLRNILLTAPLLEECVADVGRTGGVTGRTWTGTVISLPRLRVLALSRSRVEIGASLLQYMDSPILSSLDVSDRHLKLGSHLHTFLSRSQPPLKVLSISSQDANSSDLHRCLLLVPLLEDLSLTQIRAVDEILDCLTRPSQDGDPMTIICPHLESLTLRHCGSLSSHIIRNFVEKRLPPQGYLNPKQENTLSGDDILRFPQPSQHGNPALITKLIISYCYLEYAQEEREWLRERLRNTGVEWLLESWEEDISCSDEDYQAGWHGGRNSFYAQG